MYLPPCDGCGKLQYPEVYRSQEGCCDDCYARIFGPEDYGINHKVGEVKSEHVS